MRTIAAAGLIALTAVLGTAAGAAVAVPAAAGQVRTTAASASAGQLLSVSCATSRYCVAVGVSGKITANGGAVPLIETWNGRAWKIVATKLLAAGIPVLLGLSCRLATDCVAVGFYDNRSDQGVPITETWNGKKWTLSTLALPAGARGVELNGVSCPAAKSCVAVGEYVNLTGSYPLAERWNGSRWIVGKPPTLVDGEGDLEEVSCTSPAFCVAAGTDYTLKGGLLLDSWNGKTWARMAAQPSAPAEYDASLNGVSCTSPTSCVAVGGGANGAPRVPAGFAERWNGRTWRATAISWPKGTTNSDLVGVSCGSARSCVAVGHIDSAITTLGGGPSGRAAAASWNGKAWAATSLPAPGRGKASLFNYVSCLSADSCVAIGGAGPFNSIGHGLAGFWNGKSWKLVTTP
jgi:hypothetical protein